MSGVLNQLHILRQLLNATAIVYTLDAASLAAGNTINPATGEVAYVGTWFGTTSITATASGCNGPTIKIHTVTVNPKPITLTYSW